MANYFDRISLNKEAKEKAGFEQAAAQAKLQVQVDKFALQQARAKAQAQAEAAKSAIPFNLNAVVTAVRTVENIDADIAAAEAIEKELFS